jgi:tRNA-specific 2-thiouridylase
LAKNRAELSPPGEIVELEGRVIGKHAGLHRFTVGQRRGINCPSAEPYYVLELDHVNNRLVVGRKADTLSPICRVTAPHWIRPPASRSLRVHTRVRYRHEAVPSTLTVEGRGALRIRFDTPQSAVTPGQGAVFYRGDEVLGGGFIE